MSAAVRHAAQLRRPAIEMAFVTSTRAIRSRAMNEPKTSPQLFTIPLIPHGDDAADAWLARTDALLAAYERSAPPPDPDSPIVSLGFIVMAADYLWQELRAAADFEALDARAFTIYCRELVNAADAQQTFLDTMITFYDFLAAHERSLRAAKIASLFRDIAVEAMR
jgi:hypothetical protein